MLLLCSMLLAFVFSHPSLKGLFSGDSISPSAIKGETSLGVLSHSQEPLVFELGVEAIAVTDCWDVIPWDKIISLKI